MALSILEQFYHENLTWERLLEFFKQENTFLKNRLAEVVDKKQDKEFVAIAENFQNKLILKDEVHDELLQDINEQQVNIKRELKDTNEQVKNKIFIKQSKLRNEMGYFENNFNLLKNEFNKWLLMDL